ncbi:putative secreted protein [Corynebacterium renale]|uniref:AMIN-like domain-containing protein n=2 Tax=Corynebacterium renale TaxID=1724 RepID=A0A2A9DLA9_9CORY|nr:hypothetical protein [Corynebacterium renale]PFG27156.1 hypothetical protein ATK06_0205 [Corynebacterium renale]SQG64113.1 putative secreted protein [Corynebacterium renale]SQI24001.1 putative secreted protein [Corynebacterium renale]STC94354.1 putative secreted protein [Corynebacterium renale]
MFTFVSSAPRRAVAVASIAATAAIVAGCADSGNQTASPSVATETSTSMVTTTSTPAPTGDTESEAGIQPLGAANREMKTHRPQAPGELVVKDVRLGSHGNFDRVVFDLAGEGEPGWFITYEKFPAQQASGRLIDVPGETSLNVNIDNTTYPFTLGMESKPLGRFTSADTKVVTEVVEAGTFEARTQYVIGLKSEAPYSVQVLQDPTRLVIDIVY